MSQIKPGLKIDRIAYLDLLDSDGENLSDSVIINETVWHDSLRTAGKPDGSSFENSDFEKNALSWKKCGARVVYYDYLMGIYSSKQRWTPIADEFQSVCQRFAKLDIDGLGTQMECFNMWNNIFNFYTYGRTAYDTSLSIDKNLDRFCRIFEESTEYIKEIIKIGEKTADGQAPIHRISRYLIENIDREKIYDLYDKALKNTKSIRARNNIRLMRMVWHYSVLEITNPRYTDKDLGAISEANDPTGELWFMHKNFDSFTSKKEGYAIAIPVEKRTDKEFAGDKWYDFE